MNGRFIVVVSLFVFVTTFHVAYAQDSLSVCTEEQRDGIIRVINGHSIADRYIDISERMAALNEGGILSTASSKLSKLLTIINDLNELQLSWWNDVVPQLPECDLAAQVNITVGRMLDEALLGAVFQQLGLQQSIDGNDETADRYNEVADRHFALLAPLASAFISLEGVDIAGEPVVATLPTTTVVSAVGLPTPTPTITSTPTLTLTATSTATATHTPQPTATISGAIRDRAILAVLDIERDAIVTFEGGAVTVRYPLSELTVDLARSEAERRPAELSCALQEAGINSLDHRLIGTATLIDSFGTEKPDSEVASVLLKPETYRHINCGNTFGVNLEVIADEYYMHPALRE